MDSSLIYSDLFVSCQRMVAKEEESRGDVFHRSSDSEQLRSLQLVDIDTRHSLPLVETEIRIDHKVKQFKHKHGIDRMWRDVFQSIINHLPVFLDFVFHWRNWKKILLPFYLSWKVCTIKTDYSTSTNKAIPMHDWVILDFLVDHRCENMFLSLQMNRSVSIPRMRSSSPKTSIHPGRLLRERAADVDGLWNSLFLVSKTMIRHEPPFESKSHTTESVG